MITVFHRSARGASIGEFFTTWSAARDALVKLFHRRVEATAKDADGRTIGGVWKMDNRWNWYIECDPANQGGAS